MGQSNTKYFIPLHVPTEIANMLIPFIESYVVNIFFFKYFSGANLFRLKNKGFTSYESHFQLKYFLKFVNIFENL